MKRLAVLIMVLALAGCVTMKPTPPAGCENSIVWKYSPWSQVVLTGMVDAIYIGYGKDPVKYAVAKESAQKLIVLLQGTGVTYSQLQAIPDISTMLTSQLGLIFQPGQVMNRCDVEIIVAYLKMI